MALSLGERILVLFATAPEGFEATAAELHQKFQVEEGIYIYNVIKCMLKKGALARTSKRGPGVRGVYRAGPALIDEVGGEG